MLLSMMIHVIVRNIPILSVSVRSLNHNLRQRGMIHFDTILKWGDLKLQTCMSGYSKQVVMAADSHVLNLGSCLDNYPLPG